MNKDKFTKWLIKNEVCQKDKRIILDKNNVISIDKCFDLLDKLSIKIDKDILSIKKYKEAKLVYDLFLINKYTNNKKEYDLYQELLSIYLKFIYTTFEKKYSISNYISSFNCNYKDIYNINIFSELIIKELCKWPYVYTVSDSNNNYVSTVIKNDYNMLCIPIYTNEYYIDSKYLDGNYKIKREKLNLFLKKIDCDKDKHAVAIVINPEYKNDRVILEMEELFWYYYPDLSFYW